MITFFAVPEVVLISSDTFGYQGETAFLVCVGYSQPVIEISWSLNGVPVTNTSLVTTYEEVVPGVGVYKQSFLQFCSLSLSNAGNYTCVVTNGGVIDASALTSLTVSG